MSAVLLSPADHGLDEPLRAAGFLVREVADESVVPGAVKRDSPDVLVLGDTSDDPSYGVRVAAAVRAQGAALPIVFVTSRSSEALAVAALRAGIDDYIRLPAEPGALVTTVRRFVATGPVRPVRIPARRVAEPETMVGESAAMRALRTQIARMAASDTTVLVTGETGTGKELVAEALHRGSSRRAAPFVRINCAALPESLLESELFGYERGAFTGASVRAEGKLKAAEGGTVLLDEVGDMSPPGQAKLLRVLESREVQRLGSHTPVPIDVRVIAATNQNIEVLVAEQRFRKDLYYRLSVAEVCLPPLRERHEDIPALIAHFVADLNGRFGGGVEGVSTEVLEHLLHYDWPGNVRELRNVLEATLVGQTPTRIEFDHLPARYRERFRALAASPPGERERILAALFATQWNKSAAAEQLRWSRMTLYRKIAKYRLSRSSARAVSRDA